MYPLHQPPLFSCYELCTSGPFEVIDMATAMGAEPIITTTSSSTPESFADLVEYCWVCNIVRTCNQHTCSDKTLASMGGGMSQGNETTAMGRKRVADGHPAKYQLKYIEL